MIVWLVVICVCLVGDALCLFGWLVLPCVWLVLPCVYVVGDALCLSAVSRVYQLHWNTHLEDN